MVFFPWAVPLETEEIRDTVWVACGSLGKQLCVIRPGRTRSIPVFSAVLPVPALECLPSPLHLLKRYSHPLCPCPACRLATEMPLPAHSQSCSLGQYSRSAIISGRLGPQHHLDSKCLEGRGCFNTTCNTSSSRQTQETHIFLRPRQNLPRADLCHAL